MPEAPASPRKTRARRAAEWGLLLLAAWLGCSFAAASLLTRRPRPPHPEPPPSVEWASFEPHRLTTADGLGVGAWFADGRPDKPAVVLLHGHAGSRVHLLPAAEIAAKAGHPVLLVSLRAHGDSDGDRDDVGYSARRDVVAAVDWLAARLPGRPVVVWGQSMGSAAALFATADGVHRRGRGRRRRQPARPGRAGRGAGGGAPGVAAGRPGRLRKVRHGVPRPGGRRPVTAPARPAWHSPTG